MIQYTLRPWLFQLFPQLRSEAKRPPAITWFGTCLPRRSRRWPRGPRSCGSSSGTRRRWPWSRGPSVAWTQKPRENQGTNGGNPRKNWKNWENHRKIKGNPRKSWRIGDFDSGLKWSLSWVLMHTFRNQTWLGNPLWKWWIYVEGYSPWVSLEIIVKLRWMLYNVMGCSWDNGNLISTQ